MRVKYNLKERNWNFNKDPQVEVPAKNAQDSNLNANLISKPNCKSTDRAQALLLSIAAISTFYLLWASRRYGRHISDIWPTRASLGHNMGMSYLTIRYLVLATSRDS